MGQFFVWERSHQTRKEPNNIRHTGQRARHFTSKLRRRIHGLGNAPFELGKTAVRVGKVESLERRSGYHHEVDRDGSRLAPFPFHAIGAMFIVDRAHGDEFAICHYGATGRCAHEPRHRRLVARTIDAGNPMSGAVGKIVTEIRPASGTIRTDDETVLYHPAVVNGDTIRVFAATSVR